ncbi:hypothetical protein DVH24_006327 [Malus domestica]|uniref:Uncharacterized protein n=1 Tax=Malus domestica TaxID=3750 RepID=A0A498K9T7_MALDO|nr:hypothetical protein DVH24_006327 [Malus domestica]
MILHANHRFQRSELLVRLVPSVEWIDSVRKHCSASISRTIKRFRSGTAGSESSFRDSWKLFGGVGKGN